MMNKDQVPIPLADSNLAWNVRAQTTVWDIEKIRLADRLAVDQYGMQSLVLMENAGSHIAAEIDQDWRALTPDNTKPFALILCGPGNNGGDGLVIARHLEYFGWMVIVWMATTPARVSVDNGINLAIAQRAKMPLRWVGSIEDWTEQLSEECGRSTLIIDCLLGTGSSGEPSPLFASILGIANSKPVNRVAVDLPTGLDGRTGKACEAAFQAHMTYTLLALKPGLVAEGSHRFTGKIKVCPIGLPLQLLEQLQRENSVLRTD